MWNINGSFFFMFLKMFIIKHKIIIQNLINIEGSIPKSSDLIIELFLLEKNWLAIYIIMTQAYYYKKTIFNVWNTVPGLSIVYIYLIHTLAAVSQSFPSVAQV